MPLRNSLEQYLHRIGAEFSEEMLNQLVEFSEMILKYNRSLNLVSKRDPEREILKQIADSSMLTRFMNPYEDSSLIDIGSGGGIPGMVLKIFWPNIDLISLDSNPKKIAFQTEAGRKLSLGDCSFIDSQFQEYFPEAPVDFITVKALGKFKKVLTFAERVLRRDGRLILYLGDEKPDELKTISGSSFELESDDSYSLPDYPGNHHLIKFIRIK